jgi:hypothetical protein
LIVAKEIKTRITIGGKIAKSLQKAFGQTEAGAAHIEKAYKSIERVGVGAFKAVGVATVATLGSLVAMAETTRELRADLNRMYTNAEQAGISMGNADKYLAKLYSTSGELDSANEALSNLYATGFKGEKLAKVIDAVNGASIKWQDTVKQESLADALQESLASGTLTGQFSEVMSRSGADVEKFNDKLKAATTVAERQQMVYDWLAKSGLADVNAAYRESNKELIAGYEADLKKQQSMAKLGKAAEPLAAVFNNTLAVGMDKIAAKLEKVDFGKVSAAMDKAGTYGSAAFDLIWETLEKIDWETVINSGVEILGILSNIFNFVVTNWGAISPVIMGIVGAMVLYKGIMIANNTVTAISNGLKIAAATAAALQTGATFSQAAATAVATGAQVGLNLAFLACPITWIILGIAAIIAVIAAIAKKVGGFGKLWDIVWSGIKTAFGAAKDFIIGGLQAVMDFIKPVIDWVDKLLGKMGGVGKAIKTVAKFTPAGLVYSGIKKITGNADGSTVTSPTLTWVGEGGDTETIVPHNSKPRSRALALEALKGTGAQVGGNTFVFSPTIYASGLNESQLRGVLNDAAENFRAKMAEFGADSERLAYT